MIGSCDFSEKGYFLYKFNFPIQEKYFLKITFFLFLIWTENLTYSRKKNILYFSSILEFWKAFLEFILDCTKQNLIPEVVVLQYILGDCLNSFAKRDAIVV